LTTPLFDGPVISQKQMERVKGYIDLGVQEGARLIAGGQLRLTRVTDGSSSRRVLSM